MKLTDGFGSDRFTAMLTGVWMAALFEVSVKTVSFILQGFSSISDELQPSLEKVFTSKNNLAATPLSVLITPKTARGQG